MDSRFKVVFNIDVLGDGQQGLLVDARKARLVEGEDLDAHLAVLLDQLVRLLVGVEGVHQHERDVGVVLLVQLLDLLHRDVQEGEPIPHRDGGLGSLAAHGGAEAAVQLDHHQLLEERLDLGWVGRGQVSVFCVLQVRGSE